MRGAKEEGWASVCSSRWQDVDVVNRSIIFNTTEVPFGVRIGGAGPQGVKDPAPPFLGEQ